MAALHQLTFSADELGQIDVIPVSWPAAPRIERMDTIRTLYIVIGSLLILFALPLLGRRIKPNGLYGFRVPQTLADPALWYAVNAHFARRMIVTGICTALAALGLYRRFGLNLDTYAWLCLAAFVLPFALGVTQSWRYMTRWPRD